MQDRLEEFVKANRDAFDSEEPSSGVWENIEASLAEEEKVVPMSRTHWMWKAAVVILLGAVSFLLADRFSPKDDAPVAVSSMEDFMDLEAFYTSIITEKRSKLSFELEGEKFFNYLEGDIEELDAIYEELRATYTDGHESQEILDRLVHLLRQKLHLINSQLDILEEAKNPVKTKEETTSSI